MEQTPVRSEKSGMPKVAPIAILALLAIAALFLTVMLFIGTHTFNDFLFKFWDLCPVVAIIVGMILFKNKRKNLIVAIGYAFAAFMVFVNACTRLAYPGFGYALISFLLVLCIAAGYAGIALSYFFAKPKLYTLKTLGACVTLLFAFIMMIIDACVLKGTWLVQILNFLFNVLPVCAAAILFTPFKK